MTKRCDWKRNLWGLALILIVSISPAAADAQLWVNGETMTLTQDYRVPVEVGIWEAPKPGILYQNDHSVFSWNYPNYVGHHEGSVGTWNFGGTAYMDCSSEFIGFEGTGTFNQTNGVIEFNKHVGEDDGWGGTVHSGSLYLGYEAEGRGTYNLSGGTLTIPYGNVIVGEKGTGFFNQSGGTIGGSGSGAMTLILANKESSSGTYTLGDGELSAINEYIGQQSTGVFEQGGGTNRVTTGLFLGVTSGGNGAYSLKGGSLSVGSIESVGNYGVGAFTQEGGSNTAYNLYVGRYAGSSGTYEQRQARQRSINPSSSGSNRQAAVPTLWGAASAH